MLRAARRAGGDQFHKNVIGVTPAGNFYPLVATLNHKVTLSPGFDEVSGVDAYRRGCRKMLFAGCFILSAVHSEIAVYQDHFPLPTGHQPGGG